MAQQRIKIKIKPTILKIDMPHNYYDNAMNKLLGFIYMIKLDMTSKLSFEECYRIVYNLTQHCYKKFEEDMPYIRYILCSDMSDNQLSIMNEIFSYYVRCSGKPIKKLISFDLYGKVD